MKNLLLLAVLLLALPLTAVSQVGRSAWIADSDPGDTPLGDPPWGEENETFHDVISHTNVYIGINNEFRWVNMKTLTVTVFGPNVETSLELTDVLGAVKGGMMKNYRVLDVDTGTPDELTIVIEMFPQPAWEVLVFHNTSGDVITIESVSAWSDCEMVPTTTAYGLVVLALLLIGSTVWVLRRKRADAPA